MTSPAPPICFAELLWSGLYHTQTNAALLEVALRAFPSRRVLFVAESRHRAEVAAKLGRLAFGSVERVPLEEGALGESWKRHKESQDNRSHPYVQVRRARALLRALADDAGPLRDSRTVDLVLTSADASLLIAARRATQREHRLRHIEAIVHGNLSEVAGWRSRRPLWRVLDLRAAVERWCQSGKRLTVLEHHIADELAILLPKIASSNRFAVLPYPVTVNEFPVESLELASPIQVGFLGLGTHAKGLDLFVELARRLGAPNRRELRFRFCGFVHPALSNLPTDVLDDPLTTSSQPRTKYEETLKQLHYACLPLRGDYYRLSSSGTAIDAIEHLKPILTLESPLSRRLFAEGGDIGHLCRDLDHLAQTLDGLARHPNSTRYRAQVENLSRLRASRTPEALAPVMRDLWGDADGL